MTAAGAPRLQVLAPAAPPTVQRADALEQAATATLRAAVLLLGALEAARAAGVRVPGWLRWLPSRLVNWAELCAVHADLDRPCGQGIQPSSPAQRRPRRDGGRP
jgi:hypothetical protein